MMKTLVFKIAVLFVISSFSLVFFWGHSIQNKERILLQRFVEKNLKKDYYSFPLDIQHKLINTNETTGTENLYGSIWNAENMTFYSGLYYNKNNSKILEYILFIPLTQPLEDIDEVSVSSVSEIYFNNVVDNWECRIIENGTEEIGTFCESFWTADENKRGSGVISIGDGSMIYFCLIPKGSEYYDWESCSQRYKE